MPFNKVVFEAKVTKITAAFLNALQDALINAEYDIAEKVSNEQLAEAVENALLVAKNSGDFKGDKGDKGDTGVQGPQGEQGPQGPQGIQGEQGPAGNDYILTEADKEEIADMVDVQGVSVIAQPNQPTETGILWLDTDEEGDGEIPTGGGESEWKRLTRIEVAEDEVNYFLITEDENGKAFSATDFTIRIKAIKRASVSSIKIMKPNYSGGVHLATSKVIGQLNAFGNTSGDRYYTFQLLHEGNWRKVFLSESHVNIFSTTDNTWAVANNVYASGVTYTVGNVEYPLNDIVIMASNNFFIGDIIEVWYK